MNNVIKFAPIKRKPTQAEIEHFRDLYWASDCQCGCGMCIGIEREMRHMLKTLDLDDVWKELTDW